MGLFQLLFGSKRPKNVDVVPDQIWMTTEAKFLGIGNEVVERCDSGGLAVLLVAHFADVLRRLEDIASGIGTETPIKAVLAKDLNADLARSLLLDESAVIDVIVAERHPLPSVDDRLTAFAEFLPCRCRFAHHLSLEDPVISLFAGKMTKDMLKKMGMDESESIQSQFVSRRIRKAQEKIEGRSFGSHGAESATLWLEKNCPELLGK